MIGHGCDGFARHPREGGEEPHGAVRPKEEQIPCSLHCENYVPRVDDLL